MNLKHLSEL